MSVCIVLVKLCDENIERILEDPPLVWPVIAPKSPWIYNEARKNASTPSRLLKKCPFWGARHDLAVS